LTVPYHCSIFFSMMSMMSGFCFTHIISFIFSRAHLFLIFVYFFWSIFSIPYLIFVCLLLSLFYLSLCLYTPFFLYVCLPFSFILTVSS
jgi:hypothetical protein